MSEQPSDNRTEEPTPKRRQKARDDGQIARSTEFTAAVMLLGGTALIATVGGATIGNHMLSVFRLQPGWLLAEPSLPAATGLLRAVVTQTTLSLLPLGLGIMACSIGAGLVQSRGVTSWKPLKPKAERISPLAGFKRIFGADAGINLVKSAFKLLVLGLVTYVVLRGALPRFVALADAPAIQMVGALRGSVVRLALTVGLAFLVLGAFDYLIQFHRTEKQLKMSRHEVTQEYKEQEGDPLIKARVRQIARQRARRRMLTQVATADVVITNPTHIAVALKYDVNQAGAPVVVAMGERKLAERIKAIAGKSGVPIIENKPLARALRAACTVGAPIPPAFFIAVAEILAYVYKIRRRMPDAVAAAAAEMSPA